MKTQEQARASMTEMPPARPGWTRAITQNLEFGSYGCCYEQIGARAGQVVTRGHFDELKIVWVETEG